MATRFHLPRLEEWRVRDPIGIQLNNPNSLIVRSNFFHAPIQGIPKEICHYNISIFRYADLQHDRESSSSGSGRKPPEDLAKGKDIIFTTKVMKYLLKQHPEWHELGLAYDCGSSLYTSERLVFPRSAADADVDVSGDGKDFTEGPQYQEDITWPNSQTINLKVVIAPVSLIVPPIEGTTHHTPY